MGANEAVAWPVVRGENGANSRGGTFVLKRNGPRAYRPGLDLTAELPWTRGEGLGFCTSITPMPTSGRSPHRPLLFSAISSFVISCPRGVRPSSEKGPGRPEILGIGAGLCGCCFCGGAAAGTKPVPEFRNRSSRCQFWRSAPPGPRDPCAKKFSADAATADSSRADAAASGIATRAAAARCEVARRNCCTSPAAHPRRAASGLARDTPESSTAPSNRADIASSSPRRK